MVLALAEGQLPPYQLMATRDRQSHALARSKGFESTLRAHTEAGRLAPLGAHEVACEPTARPHGKKAFERRNFIIRLQVLADCAE